MGFGGGYFLQELKKKKHEKGGTRQGLDLKLFFSLGT